ALKDAHIKTSILKAIQRPAEGKPWHEYRKIFLTRNRIDQGVAFWNRHRELLDKVQQTYGVPAEIIVAILGVETFYGTRTGSFRVLDALTTLAFAYPRRADFFRRELEHFFLLAQEEKMDPRQPLGSYAGAMGWPQFMPSSYRRYAADFDGDGKRDIWNNPADVIASIANYFAKHGWQKDQPIATPLPKVAIALADTDLQPHQTLAELKARGLAGLDLPYPDSRKAVVMVFDSGHDPEAWLGFPNFYVITRYNHSRLYAMAVFQLSEAIRSRVETP
ncbi:MAG TPA: lytic murein transglycosylase B, partial [Methylothermaceae bacterium]|nr:lytic murein transglycosylase B [Methylothermaceae bacterium]